jgi:hypothetical protein
MVNPCRMIDRGSTATPRLYHRTPNPHPQPSKYKATSYYVSGRHQFTSKLQTRRHKHAHSPHFRTSAPPHHNHHSIIQHTLGAYIYTNTLPTMAQANPPTTTDPTTSYTDPTFSLLNNTCLDLLLIELVPMAYRITADLAQREEEWIHGASKPKRLSGTSGASNDASSTVAGGTARGTEGGPVGGTATVDEEEAREAVFHRLESLGYRVGLGVVERYVMICSSHHLPSTLIPKVKFPQIDSDNHIQFLSRRPPPNNPPRRHKIPLQRPLDPTLPQANRQPKNKPPRNLRLDRQHVQAARSDELRYKKVRCSHAGSAGRTDRRHSTGARCE